MRFLKFCACLYICRISFRKELFRLVDTAVDIIDGDAFLKVLQIISGEVQKLEEVIGNIDDWLHFIDSQGSEIESSRRPPVISNENTSSEKTTHSMNTTQNRSSEKSEDEFTYCLYKYMVRHPNSNPYRDRSAEPPTSDFYRDMLAGIFVKPFQRYLDVNLKTFKDIENEMRYLLESAPMRYRQRVIHQMDDLEMYRRIEAR